MSGATTQTETRRPDASDWQSRLAHIVETVREMSTHTEPQEMVRAYTARMKGMFRFDRSVSLSRRGLEWPRFRVTRDSAWKEVIDPWKQPERLPQLEGGVMAELIYGNQPRIFGEFRLAESDPGAAYLGGYRSVMAIPHYDHGESLNMVVHMVREANAFDPEQFPQFVQTSNLFGRATHNLVLSSELRTAYGALDREMEVVADIQRSLLPVELPEIPTLRLAAAYQTSKRAGGDYYDLFRLPEGRWGILIADVSGHGTPAAVVMAIMHAIAHAYPGQPTSPAGLMTYINRSLALRYTGSSGAFVTAFYGVYDPARRSLVYSSAGHNPPRLRLGASGEVVGLDAARDLPLGIREAEQYRQETVVLSPGDALALYTDGITEAWSADGGLYGVERLDAALRGLGQKDAPEVVDGILASVAAFAEGRAADDDRTLLVGVVG